jgi:hypothetical protein
VKNISRKHTINHNPPPFLPVVPVLWIGLSNFWHLVWALHLLITQLFWWFSVLIYIETQAITMSHSCHERYYFKRAFYRFNPAPFLCLSEARTWIPNIICHGLFNVQWFEVRGDCSFCWPSLFKVSLHIFLHHVLFYKNWISLYRLPLTFCR